MSDAASAHAADAAAHPGASSDSEEHADYEDITEADSRSDVTPPPDSTNQNPPPDSTNQTNPTNQPADNLHPGPQPAVPVIPVNLPPVPVDQPYNPEDPTGPPNPHARPYNPEDQTMDARNRPVSVPRSVSPVPQTPANQPTSPVPYRQAPTPTDTTPVNRAHLARTPDFQFQLRPGGRYMANPMKNTAASKHLVFTSQSFARLLGPSIRDLDTHATLNVIIRLTPANLRFRNTHDPVFPAFPVLPKLFDVIRSITHTYLSTLLTEDELTLLHLTFFRVFNLDDQPTPSLRGQALYTEPADALPIEARSEVKGRILFRLPPAHAILLDRKTWTDNDPALSRSQMTACTGYTYSFELMHKDSYNPRNHNAYAENTRARIAWHPDPTIQRLLRYEWLHLLERLNTFAFYLRYPNAGPAALDYELGHLPLQPDILTAYGITDDSPPPELHRLPTNPITYPPRDIHGRPTQLSDKGKGKPKGSPYPKGNKGSGKANSSYPKGDKGKGLNSSYHKGDKGHKGHPKGNATTPPPSLTPYASQFPSSPSVPSWQQEPDSTPYLGGSGCRPYPPYTNPADTPNPSNQQSVKQSLTTPTNQPPQQPQPTNPPHQPTQQTPQNQPTNPPPQQPQQSHPPPQFHNPSDPHTDTLHHAQLASLMTYITSQQQDITTLRHETAYLTNEATEAHEALRAMSNTNDQTNDRLARAMTIAVNLASSHCTRCQRHLPHLLDTTPGGRNPNTAPLAYDAITSNPPDHHVWHDFYDMHKRYLLPDPTGGKPRPVPRSPTTLNRQREQVTRVANANGLEAPVLPRSPVRSSGRSSDARDRSRTSGRRVRPTDRRSDTPPDRRDDRRDASRGRRPTSDRRRQTNPRSPDKDMSPITSPAKDSRRRR